MSKPICEKCAKFHKKPIPDYWFEFMPLWAICFYCHEEKECVEWKDVYVKDL